MGSPKRVSSRFPLKSLPRERRVFRVVCAPSRLLVYARSRAAGSSTFSVLAASSSFLLRLNPATGASLDPSRVCDRTEVRSVHDVAGRTPFRLHDVPNSNGPLVAVAEEAVPVTEPRCARTVFAAGPRPRGLRRPTLFALGRPRPRDPAEYRWRQRRPRDWERRCHCGQKRESSRGREGPLSTFSRNNVERVVEQMWTG